MAGINTKNLRTAKPMGQTPVATAAQDTTTFEGAAAYSRDAKSELFMLAVSFFWGEPTFYEGAGGAKKGKRDGGANGDRNVRFVRLIQQVAAEDPAWLSDFLPWLRRRANIRTASVVGAMEAARAMVGLPHEPGEQGLARKVISATLSRPDEPAEGLAYWLSTYGRKMPPAVRRGLADSARVQYTERNVIRYNSKPGAVRMADVLELTHPRFSGPQKSALATWLLGARRRDTPVPEILAMLTANRQFLSLDEAARKRFLTQPDVSQLINEAGLTWEQVSSGGAFTAKTWEALIPTMGIFALVRNLRNFEQTGVGPAAIEVVRQRLMDEGAVRRSRMFPYRFLAAYVAATNAAWAEPLEAALQAATTNLPALPGRTLVLVDTSGSMSQVGMSAKSAITPVMAGALFGIALAAKGEQVDVVGYANGVFSFPATKGASVLRMTERFIGLVGSVGHGTETAASLKKAWRGHDRVVIVTDEQTFGGWRGNVSDQIPITVPIYAANMVGYAPAMMESGSTRHQLGGLSDATYSWIAAVEAGRRQEWPWLQEQTTVPVDDEDDL